MKPGLVTIGTSAGGVRALQIILQGLSKGFRLPIAVVHHLPANAQIDFRMAFHRFSSLDIQEVEDKMPLRPGTVFFGPPGYHLLVEKEGIFSLSVDEPVNYSRPSVDVLFSSAAESFGRNAVGVLLTGANHDGARGLKQMHDGGGYTIVQNPKTAEFPSMPASALELFKPDEVLDLEKIADSLNRRSREWTDG